MIDVCLFVLDGCGESGMIEKEDEEGGEGRF